MCQRLLLEAVGQLQHFTRLHLQGSLQEYYPPAAAERFAPVTASTALRSLNLSHVQCAAGVWQHMLPPDRQLPRLPQLVLDQPRRVTVTQRPAQQPMSTGSSAAAWH